MKYPKTPNPNYYIGNPQKDLRAKIKLHGTHASIFVGNSHEEVIPGKRSTEIGTNCGDHYNFEKFVETFKLIESLRTNCCIFGEWCGPKIQKKVACSMIKERSFFIYAVAYDGLFFWDVDIIKTVVPDLPENCYIIPYINDNYYSLNDLDDVKLLVEEIDKEDPYIKSLFDISGHGEGLVLMNPYCFPFSEDGFLRNSFKVKGDSHQKSVAKVVKEPLSLEELPLLGDLREDIFEKALEASGSKRKNLTTIGAFLKEVNTDFYAENRIVIDDLDQRVKKCLYSQLTSYAKKWFLN